MRRFRFFVEECMVRRHLITTLTIVTLAGPLAASAQLAPRNEAPPDPRPARNEVVRPQGPFAEVLLLRPQYLDKGLGGWLGCGPGSGLAVARVGVFA